MSYLHHCRVGSLTKSCGTVQAMAFLAGANSIFSGDKLLTTPNPDEDTDTQLFKVLGLKGRPAFVPYAAGEESSKHGCSSSM